MMIAGKTTWLGYCKSTFCPLDNITPMDGSGAWRPSPMYARKDSEKMAVGADGVGKNMTEDQRHILHAQGPGRQYVLTPLEPVELGADHTGRAHPVLDD